MLDTYSGFRLLNALYVRTALLYKSLLSIERQPSSLNMSADGVLKSGLRIILAARFCSLRSRSRLDVDVVRWLPYSSIHLLYQNNQLVLRSNRQSFAILLLVYDDNFMIRDYFMLLFLTTLKSLYVFL